MGGDNNSYSRDVIVYVWFLRTLSDLTVLASGRVAKNSALDRSARQIVLVYTRMRSSELARVIEIIWLTQS